MSYKYNVRQIFEKRRFKCVKFNISCRYYKIGAKVTMFAQFHWVHLSCCALGKLTVVYRIQWQLEEIQKRSWPHDVINSRQVLLCFTTCCVPKETCCYYVFVLNVFIHVWFRFRAVDLQNETCLYVCWASDCWEYILSNLQVVCLVMHLLQE